MKTVAAAGTGLGGLVTAVAGAGWYAMAGVGLLLLSTMVVTCWVVTNQSRTRNAVELITAVRGQNAASSANPLPEPPPGRWRWRR